MQLLSYTLIFLALHTCRAQGHPPFILFDDGLKIYGEAALDSGSLLGGWTLRMKDGTSIPVLHVHSFRNSTGTFYRLSNRSIMTRKERTGTISLYAAVGNDLVYANDSQPEPFGAPKYFSKNDGPLLPLNFDNLYEAVRDNDASKASLDLSLNFRYAKYGTLAVTAICITYDFHRNAGVGKTPSATIVSGVIAIGIGIMSHFVQSVSMERAIEEYNK